MVDVHFCEKENFMLVWKENANNHSFYAMSENSVTGSFRIVYDDVMYWPSWSPDCTQDINVLKLEAQELHDQGVDNTSK